MLSAQKIVSKEINLKKFANLKNVDTKFCSKRNLIGQKLVPKLIEISRLRDDLTQKYCNFVEIIA